MPRFFLLEGDFVILFFLEIIFIMGRFACYKNLINVSIIKICYLFFNYLMFSPFPNFSLYKTENQNNF